MRSRNDLPAPAVMRTTMKSDRTRVPPVTPERSPPASRTTGADSPVMADSSTEATPSIISPSPGMISPASTKTLSPSFNSVDAVFSREPSGRTRTAGVSWRVLRSVSAWALPRASARASAKLANNTVSSNQTSRAIKYPSVAAVEVGSRILITVATIDSIVPISTTNITGFFTWMSGRSMMNARTRAARSKSGANNPCRRLCRRASLAATGSRISGAMIHLHLIVQKALVPGDRPPGQARLPA